MLVTALFGAGALLLALPTSGNAQAGPASTRSAQIGLADLDLSSPAGREALDRRVTHAARLLCGPVSPADLAGQQRQRRCVANARSDARAQRDRLTTKGHQPEQLAGR